MSSNWEEMTKSRKENHVDDYEKDCLPPGVPTDGGRGGGRKQMLLFFYYLFLLFISSIFGNQRSLFGRWVSSHPQCRRLTLWLNETIKVKRISRMVAMHALSQRRNRCLWFGNVVFWERKHFRSLSLECVVAALLRSSLLVLIPAYDLQTWKIK